MFQDSMRTDDEEHPREKHEERKENGFSQAHSSQDDAHADRLGRSGPLQERQTQKKKTTHQERQQDFVPNPRDVPENRGIQGIDESADKSRSAVPEFPGDKENHQTRQAMKKALREPETAGKPSRRQRQAQGDKTRVKRSAKGRWPFIRRKGQPFARPDVSSK